MKRITHRPTGLTITLEPNLLDQNRIFINIQGDSVTSCPATRKSITSLVRYLEKVAAALDHESDEYRK